MSDTSVVRDTNRKKVLLRSLSCQLLQGCWPSQPRSAYTVNFPTNCAVGDRQSKLYPKQIKKKKILCHITGKAPCQAPTTTFELQLSLPHSFSLRENLTIKKTCLYQRRRGGGGGGSQDATGVPVFVARPPFQTTLSSHLKQRKGAVSEREKCK